MSVRIQMFLQEMGEARSVQFVLVPSGLTALGDEAVNHVANSLQRRESQKDHAASRVGARKSFYVNILRGLLVEPDEVERLALP